MQDITSEKATPSRLLNKFRKDLNVSVKTTPYVDLQSKVFDIKLNRHKEDELYFQNDWYRANLRRGFSMIAPLSFDKESASKTRILRKGLPKFFDLDIRELGFRQSILYKTAVLGYYLKNETLFPVTVYMTEKANGENFQASFDQTINKYVICSKNVSVLVADREELDSIQDDLHTSESTVTNNKTQKPGHSRYKLVKLMGQSFFDVVERLPEQKQINLQTDLSSKTMVAEFCGHRDLQHLVKYTDVDIRVFALVEKTSTDICLSPTECVSFSQKYGFSSVAVNKKELGSVEELEKYLKAAYTAVFFKPVSRDSEGAILYFESSKVGVTHVVKLKTLDYRVKRKIREKIRMLLNPQKKVSKNTPDQVLEKFTHEVRDLVCFGRKPQQKKYMPEKILKQVDYFTRLGEFMIKLGVVLDQARISVLSRFVDFLVISKPLFELEYFLDFKRDTTLYVNIVRLSFDQEKYLDKFTCLYSNRPIPFPILLNLRNELQTKEFMNIEVTLPQKVITFVPLGIIGSGKTYALENIFRPLSRDMSLSLFEISSDTLSRQVIQEMKANPTKNGLTIHDSEELVFYKSGKKRRITFEKEMLKVYLEIRVHFDTHSGSDNYNQNIHQQENIQGPKKHKQTKVLLYIDKNHPVGKQLDSTLTKYCNHLSLYDSVMVGIIPQPLQIYSSRRWRYFDDKTLFICLSNVLHRENHDTLNVSKPKQLNVFLFFLGFFPVKFEAKRHVNYLIEYSLDYDVYFNVKTTKSTEKQKMQIKDFEDFGRLLQKLFDFKKANDKSDTQTDPLKKISQSNDFVSLMTQQPEYRKVIDLLSNSVVDYTSRSKESSKNFTKKVKTILLKSVLELADWRKQRKLSPYYLGFHISSFVCESFTTSLKALNTTKKEDINNLTIVININLVEIDNEWFFFHTQKPDRKVRVISNLHVTLAFFEDSESTESILPGFRENVKVSLTLSHLLYVHPHLLTFVVCVNSEYEKGLQDSGIESRLGVPHVTCMVDGCVPRDSNKVLMQISSRLESEGRTISDITGSRKFKKVKLSSGKVRDCVGVELPRGIKVPAWSRQYYK